MADKKSKRRRVLKSPHVESASRVNKRIAQSPCDPARSQQIAGHHQPDDPVQAFQRLLLAVSRVQALFIDEAKPEAVFDVLLQELLTLTDSEYGFIGEVGRTPEGQPFLRTHAITDIAWNAATKELMAQQAPTLEFRNLKTLFGQVMTTGKPVISNDPAHDLRAGGLPPGHPPMHAFLGLPFYRGERMTGMVGIANRPGGYDEALAAYLEPFLSTCAQLLEGYRNRQQRAEAETALQEREERWHLAMRGSHDGIWDWNIATGMVFFSVRWKHMHGYEDHELTGSLAEWQEGIHPDDCDRVLHKIDLYLTKQSPEFCEEYRVRRKDGSWIWILDRGVALWDATGVAVRMAGSETDITYRKQAEQALLEAHTAVELAMEGISKLDDTGHYLFANPQYAALLGYRPEELIGQSWEITVHPDDRISVVDTFARMLAVGKAETEIRGVKKDGTLIYKHVVIVKPDGPAGKMPGHYCFARDITERKRQEAVLSAEKQALELVAKGAGLSEVLTFICQTIEDHTAPMRTSVMLVTEDGKYLRCMAAPSLPEAYNHAVEVIPIGPTVGSCGSAAYFGKPAIVTDIESDPLWKDYVRVTRAHGLRACWSHPILSSTGTVLGTFAAYFKEPRTPSPGELAVVERAGHLAAVAIQHIKMGEALRESEARFQAFMTHSPTVSFIKDSTGRHLYINPTFERLFGIPLSEIRGKTLDGRLPPEVVAQLQANDEKVLSSGQAMEVEETVPTPDGKSQHWLVLKFPLTSSAGELFLGGIAIDITARKQAEAARETLQYAVDRGMEGIALLDGKGRYTYLNEAHARIYGYRASELTGRSWKTLYGPDQIAWIESEVFPAMQSKGNWHGELIGRTINGASVYVEVGLQRLPQSAVLPEVLMCTCRDITERKRAEEEQLRMRTLLTNVINTTPDLVFVKDRQLRTVLCNQVFAQALGKEPADLIGHTDIENGWEPELVHGDPDKGIRGFEQDDRAVLSGQIVHNANDPANVNGAIRIFDTFKVPLRDERGAITGVLGISRDVTERKWMEDALRTSQERFELAVQATNDGIWDWNIQTGEQYWSGRHFELFGLEPRAFTPTYDTWISQVHPDDADRVHQATWHHLKTREPYDIEVRVRMNDGRYRWFHDQGQAVWGADGTPLRMVGSISDVTERKAAEEALRVAHGELERRVVERTAALRHSEQRYAALVNSVEGIILEVDYEAYRITFVSQQAERILGYSVEQWLNDPMFWVNHIHPDDRSWAPACYQDMTKQGHNHVFEYRMLASDGRIVWIKDAVSVMSGDDGKVRLCCILLDVTKDKEIVERLQLTQYAVDHASDQIFIIGPDGSFRDVNESACTRLGYTKDELLTMSVTDIDPDFPVGGWDSFWADFLKMKRIQLETRHRSKSGEIYPIEVVANYLNHDGQELDYAIVRDISERKRNETALLESEERFSKAFNESSIGMAITALDGRWLQVNQALCEIVGYLKAELETMTFQSITHPDDLEQDLRHVRLLLTGELRTYQLEKRYLHKNGAVIWIVLNVSLVRNADGTPKHFISQIQDITERKRIEDKLRATQYAVDHAADQIFIIGPDGSFLDVNESACCRLGYTKQELLTMSVMDIDLDYSREIWPQHWEEFKQAGRLRVETRHRSKSGEIYPVEVTANYYMHNGQELDYAIVRDVTERRCAEASIRDSELRYKLLTEATFDGIAIHDQGILLEVNAGLERMFGYESGELIGRSMWDLIAEESRELVLANMRNGINGPYEAIGLRKDGTTFPGEVVVRPYWYRGKAVRLVAGRDITARKHLEAERSRHTEELERQVLERTAEIAKLESQRAQTEKLAAMGRLAAGVAHEINNPIAGIKNAFTLVKQAVNPAHPQYEFVGLVDREIDRVTAIVQNMYQLYRRESGKVETVDLQTMVGDIVALFATLLQQRQLKLLVDVDPSLNRLDVPRSDLLQVLLNLLNNAIDSSYEKSMIRLTMREEGEVVRIAVADQGAGIHPDVLPHIFDPFFTTKTTSDQKGMGLGLSISQSLVTAMGGKIEAHTLPGQGSTFSVLLPRDRVVMHVADQPQTNKEVMTHGN